MSGINLNVIDELRSRRTGQHGEHAPLPAGRYVGRVMGLRQSPDQWGRATTKVTLEILDSPFAGRRLYVDVHGAAERVIQTAMGSKARVEFDVYVRQRGDGRAFNAINVETIRLCAPGGSAGHVATPAEVPTAEQWALATTGFDVGFRCLDRINAIRELVDWHELFVTMATCSGVGLMGRTVFGSTYAFNGDMTEHAAVNARGGKPGSLADYTGMVHSPLLIFDIDRKDANGNGDVGRSLEDVIRLYAFLLERGIDARNILLSFSGNKGFHLQIPSMVAAALPSKLFAKTAGRFCGLLAAEAGVAIDPAMYQSLQPLRAPNSRHDKSGLFKVMLTPDELLGLSARQIQSLASTPRRFTPPSFACEPLPVLAELWVAAEQLVHSPPLVRGTADERTGAPRLFRATWDYLVNGALEGCRATEHFKAAANLMDFETKEDLVSALLERPAELSGLPAVEAAATTEGAIQRCMRLSRAVDEPLGDHDGL